MDRLYSGEADSSSKLKDDECLLSQEQPRKVAVVGAGYIAVELAGVFQSLGTSTTLLVRRDRPLRPFDSMLVEVLTSEMEKSGLTLKTHSTPKVGSSETVRVNLDGSTKGEKKHFDPYWYPLKMCTYEHVLHYLWQHSISTPPDDPAYGPRGPKSVIRVYRLDDR